MADDATSRNRTAGPSGPSASQPKRGGQGSRGGRGGGRARGRGRPKKSTTPAVPLDEAANFTPVPYDPPIQQAPHSTAMHPLAQQPPVTHPLARQPPSMGQQPLSNQPYLSSQRLPSAQQPSFAQQPPFGQQPPFSQQPSFTQQPVMTAQPSLTQQPPFLQQPPLPQHLELTEQQLSFEQPWSQQDLELFQDQHIRPGDGSLPAPLGLLDIPEEDPGGSSISGPDLYDDDPYHEADVTIRPSDNMQLLHDQTFFAPPNDGQHAYALTPSLGPAPAAQVPNTVRMGGAPIDPRELHRRLSQPSHQLSGPPVDVLATSRTRRSSVRLPSPSDLLAAQRSSPRAESVISGTSSLCTNTSSHASTGYTSKVDKHGIVRNVRRVHRRTLAELPAASTTSAKSIPVSEVTNISKASSIFISDLFNKHAWPSTSMKRPMIVEAFQQSNAMAKREGRDTTEFLKDHEAKVRQVGSQMRTDLKAAILNSIHLWGVLPSAEERMTMSAGEVKDFVATRVAELRSTRGYVHHGKDSEGNDAFFNHPAYLTFITDYTFGPKGPALSQPHRFVPKYPTPGMALVSSLADVVFAELATGEYVPMRLNETHRQVYLKDHKLLDELNSVPYYRFFLTKTRKKISSDGSARMGFIQQDEMEKVPIDPRIDFTLKLPDGFVLDEDDEGPVAGPSNTSWD